jgi:predicted acyltransferase
MRYLSLDFFRGLTIALMIVVNTPGTWSHVYAPLRHAEWHGCTPTDLVFPFFLFIVGVAIWFSFSKFNGQLDGVLARKILRRTVLIFLVGLALNAYPFFNKNYAELRIMGVLQRIALAYGLAAFLCVWLKKRDILPQAALVLLAYWAALAIGGGYSLESNLVRQIDLALLTEHHVYKGFGLPFDPEGLFSSFPAAVTVMLGYFCGSLIAAHGADKWALLRQLLLYGVVMGAVGLLWDLVFPINKPLWTSSYVLYSAGLAMIFLSFCIWALDIRGWQAPARPFLVFGANPLFAFVLSGLLVKTMNLFRYTDAEGASHGGYHWLYKNLFYPIDAGNFGSLLFALCYAGFIWLLCWMLYRRKIFIKI